MSASEYQLTNPPSDPRQRELWLQHAIGFILFQDIREYAVNQIDPTLSDVSKAAACKAIDDAMYGMMMVLDGVAGGLSNASTRVTLRTIAELVDIETEEVIESLDLLEGDGMCMGYHGWIVQDFGNPRPFTKE